MTQTRVITVYGRLPGADEEIGGPIRHGENPASAVVRLFREEAGLPVVVSGVLHVGALVTPSLHEDRVTFALVPASPDAAAAAPADEAVESELPKGQRFAAYGFVTDRAGRVLLTRIAPGFPGAGRWHLPGGGTDVGEQPADALLRELFEETGQRGEIVELLGVTHRRSLGVVGPEGYPMNWHAVRALYRVLVPEPSVPSVTEAAGGSTAEAAWFDPAELSGLAVTEVVQWAGSLPATGSDGSR
ncbi:NUDIX hydrolase [Dactylosporangium salmoneum]|uniref:Nudix hydrolase domain-containing protein n=1 Tax=Dactylosporangium salmoneum TaxID=53361 RepID=A0ABP5U0P3_9ACTN